MDQETLVKDMIRTMTLPKERLEKPMAVILVGAPATGKTFFAKKIITQLPLAYFNNQQIERYLMPHVKFFDNDQVSLQFSFAVIRELIKQKVSVLYDYSVDRISDRHQIKEEVTQLGGQVIVVAIECDDEVVYRRIKDDNIKIVGGAKKGFVLDQDHYLYKKGLIQSPLSENAFLSDCNDQYASDRFVALVQAKLKNPEKFTEF